MEDKKLYQLEVLYTSDWGNEVTHRFHVLAESKWEAIERALTRYRELQPDRTYYKIISGGWSYEVGRQISSLAAQAFDYSMRYS
jgi:hypothetical protein